jgi:WD40 repeat protein
MSTLGPNYIWRSRRTGRELLTLVDVESAHFTVSRDRQRFFTSNATGGRGREYRFIPPTGVREVIVNPSPSSYASAGKGSLAFTADGEWLIATADDMVAIVSTTNPHSVVRIPVSTANNSEDLTVALMGNESFLYVCGRIVGLRRHRIDFSSSGLPTIGEPETVDAATGFDLRDVSADATRMLLTSRPQGKIMVYEHTSDGARKVAEWATASPYSAAFDPTGTQALVNYDTGGPNSANAKLTLWDIASGSAVRTFEETRSGEVDWNKAARVALTSNGPERTTIWHTDSWTHGAELPPDLSGNDTSFAISPDGRMAVFANDQVIRLVNLADGNVIATLAPSTAMQFSMGATFSPDGKRIAVILADARVFLWDLAELGQELQQLGLDW